MKLLLLYGALLAAPALANVPIPASTHTTPATKVAVFFSHKTTFAQLATIKQDLLTDGITINYDRLEFDQSGKLLKISFHVNCQDGVADSATNDHLTDDSFFGFVRDFTPGVAKPLRMGNI